MAVNQAWGYQRKCNRGQLLLCHAAALSSMAVAFGSRHAILETSSRDGFAGARREPSGSRSVWTGPDLPFAGPR
jgi:hypothetical protein